MILKRFFILGLTLLTACSGSALQGVRTYSYPGGQHQDGLIICKESSAVGDPHNPVWPTCGVYTAPLHQMSVVHSLEHGAVSITYRPTLPSGQLNTLKELVRAHSYTLLLPFENQQFPIVLSAWGAQLGVDDASDARIKAFLDKYEQAKASPEPSAPCSRAFVI